MVFLNKTFLGHKNSLTTNHSLSKEFTQAKINGAIFDELYLSIDANYEYSDGIPSEWNDSTLLHAYFNGNLLAGNLDFITRDVEKLRVKRRDINAYEWTTLYEVSINQTSDFKFTFRDYTAKARKEYEYAIVPITGGIEGNYSVNTVYSDFEGLFVYSKQATYYALLETSLTLSRRSISSIIEPLNSKYPIVHTTSKQNSIRGTAKGIFVQYDSDVDEFDIEGSCEYQDALLEYLLDGYPKIIKHEDGRAYLAKIVEEPSMTPEGHPDKVSTTFNFVEIGNIDSSTDLYANGLIDLVIEG